MLYLDKFNPPVLRLPLVRSVVGDGRGLSFAGGGEAVVKGNGAFGMGFLYFVLHLKATAKRLS